VAIVAQLEKLRHLSRFVLEASGLSEFNEFRWSIVSGMGLEKMSAFANGSLNLSAMQAQAYREMPDGDKLMTDPTAPTEKV